MKKETTCVQTWRHGKDPHTHTHTQTDDTDPISFNFISLIALCASGSLWNHLSISVLCNSSEPKLQLQSQAGRHRGTVCDSPCGCIMWWRPTTRSKTSRRIWVMSPLVCSEWRESVWRKCSGSVCGRRNRARLQETWLIFSGTFAEKIADPPSATVAAAQWRHVQTNK